MIEISYFLKVEPLLIIEQFFEEFAKKILQNHEECVIIKVCLIDSELFFQGMCLVEELSISKAG